jgi:hypothetical protein
MYKGKKYTKNKTPTICMMRIQNAASDAFPPFEGGAGGMCFATTDFFSVIFLYLL